MADKTAEEVTTAITEAAGEESKLTFENLEEKKAETTEGQTQEAAEEVSEPEKKAEETEVVSEEKKPETEEQVWPEKLAGLSEAERAKAYLEAEATLTRSRQELSEAKSETAGWKQAFGTMAGIEKQTGAPALSKEQIAENFNMEFYANPHGKIQEAITQAMQGGIGSQVNQVQNFQNAQMVVTELQTQLGEKAPEFAEDIKTAFKENPHLWKEESPAKAVKNAITIVKGMRYDTDKATAQTQGAEAVTAKQNASTLRPGTGTTQTGSPNYTEAEVVRTAKIIQTGLPLLSDADARKEAISALRGK